MTVILTNIEAIVNNDEVYNFTLSYNGAPLDLTELTPNFYLKASRSASDDDATQITPTVPNAFLGEISVTIPHDSLATAGTLWYRIDVVDSDMNVTTVLFGNVYVLSA